MKYPVMTKCEKLVPKSATLPQPGTSAALIPSPPNEKLADLKLFSQVGLQISMCHFTPSPFLLENGKLPDFKSNWTSEFKVPLYPKLAQVKNVENKTFELCDLPFLTTYLLLCVYKINNNHLM